MVRVSIEVRNGASRFNVAVRARSIRRAMSVARNWCSDSEVKAKFPINSESFFVENPTAIEGQFEIEERERIVA